MSARLRRMTAAALCSVALTALTAPIFAQNQLDLITPVTTELTFVFIPKVIHPW